MQFFIINGFRINANEKKPTALLLSFNALLVEKDDPEGYHAHYLKWLRYYLDFCHKYEKITRISEFQFLISDFPVFYNY